ncbi:MAG: HIT family protein [Alphaproteobacteria bacterium]|nr:HIT family protein [Alphaproteobacteria bacterium]
MFELVPGLAKKDFIINLKLCTVLFEDNRLYPWIFLVPQKENVKNMTFLSMEERLQLMREIALAEEVMTNLFNPSQINVAMIGNKTPQLHVHIIARKDGDPDWPGTVWDGHSSPYDPSEKEKIIARIKQNIEEKLSLPQFSQD